MDEDVKNALALDVLVNNEKVNVIELSGKMKLPIAACSAELEKWLKACPEKERQKISREFMVESVDSKGNHTIRIVTEEIFSKLENYTKSTLFSVEKNRNNALSSTKSSRCGMSTFKRIKKAPKIREIINLSAIDAVPEVVKEAPKEIKKEPPKKSTASSSNMVSRFFGEQAKEKPKVEPKESKLPVVEKPVESTSVVREEVKSDSGSDKAKKISPVKEKAPVKPKPGAAKPADKKSDGKFKGKAAPVGSRTITSFFTKVPKSAIPPPPPIAVVKEKTPERVVEPAKKRALSEEKSPPAARKSSPPKNTQKKMKVAKKQKPKVKAGTSRILQIVDDDSSDEENEMKIEIPDDSDHEEKSEVVLENEEVKKETTPPRPYKKKKKKLITECFRDEDGYDNFTTKEVDCSSEEEN